MDIIWGGLTFRVLNSGKVALIRSFDFDNTERTQKHPRMAFSETELAGGATSGTIRMHNAEASGLLRYAGHTGDDSALEILLRSETLEVTCRFTKYADTNAIRATQQVRNISDEEICLETANTATVYFGNAVDDNKNWRLHRYDQDTVARIRTDYVHELQDRLRVQLEDAQRSAESGAGRMRTAAVKRAQKIEKQLIEMGKYEEIVHHYADMRIELDLDDGVKVNYAKLAELLTKIK